MWVQFPPVAPYFMNKEMEKLKRYLKESRIEFLAEVEQAALETIEISKDIASAIGEISIVEAKEALVKIFNERLMSVSFHGEFKAKE